MIIDNPKDYKFIEFQEGKFPKKYVAILQNKKTNIIKKIPFGDQRYSQYKDSTGLNLYSHLDHLDKKRRALYYARFGKDAPLYSPKYWSHRFLW